MGRNCQGRLERRVTCTMSGEVTGKTAACGDLEVEVLNELTGVSSEDLR